MDQTVTMGLLAGALVAVVGAGALLLNPDPSENLDPIDALAASYPAEGQTPGDDSLEGPDGNTEDSCDGDGSSNLEEGDCQRGEDEGDAPPDNRTDSQETPPGESDDEATGGGGQEGEGQDGEGGEGGQGCDGGNNVNIGDGNCQNGDDGSDDDEDP